MSSGRTSEGKQDDLFAHRLSPESSEYVWTMTAGLLAFHIAGAFPSSLKTVAMEASNKTVDLQLRGQLRINALRQHRYSLLISR
jgi:hypothetical protein